MILRDILGFLTGTLVPLFRSVSLVYNIEIMSFFAVIWLIKRPDTIIKSTNLNTWVIWTTKGFKSSDCKRDVSHSRQKNIPLGEEGRVSVLVQKSWTVLAGWALIE